VKPSFNNILCTDVPPELRTFWVDTRVWDCTNVTHSGMVATRTKDAICDAIRDSCQGMKPPPPEHGANDADIPLFLTLYRDRATLYRDMSGVSLHKRGYRDAMHRASLNEGVAAGMLKLAGFGRGGFKRGAEKGNLGKSKKGDENEARAEDEESVKSGTSRGRVSGDENNGRSEGVGLEADGDERLFAKMLGESAGSERDGERLASHSEAGSSGRSSVEVTQVLLDPMCGSGTLLIEAALMATNKAPGLLRKRWPFQVGSL
jgi:hypothetical protein